VAFYVVVLSFTREFIMQSFLRRWAIYSGLKSRNMQNRYMEQAYTAIYFCVSGPVGLYVMSRTPVWYFNTEGMFADFPHRSHEGIFKAYYLLQASYWAQQAIVLCLQQEKPRKDFKELVAHHIITLTLIWLSYRFHFTYMGVAVYVTHDISDFFLAVSRLFARASPAWDRTARLMIEWNRPPKRSTTRIIPSSCPGSPSSLVSGSIFATTSTSIFSTPSSPPSGP